MKRGSRFLVGFAAAALTFGSLMFFVGPRHSHYGYYGRHHGQHGYYGKQAGYGYDRHGCGGMYDQRWHDGSEKQKAEPESPLK